MKFKLLIVIASSLLAVASTSVALAHDERMHKGKATEGEIVTVEPGRFVMKTDEGQKTVTVDAKTKVEVGGNAGETDDLKRGDHVAVIGTKLPGGEIVAKEVLVHSGDSKDRSSDRHADEAHDHDHGHE